MHSTMKRGICTAREAGGKARAGKGHPAVSEFGNKILVPIEGHRSSILYPKLFKFPEGQVSITKIPNLLSALVPLATAPAPATCKSGSG